MKNIQLAGGLSLGFVVFDESPKVSEKQVEPGFWNVLEAQGLQMLSDFLASERKRHFSGHSGGKKGLKAEIWEWRQQRTRWKVFLPIFILQKNCSLNKA